MSILAPSYFGDQVECVFFNVSEDELQVEVIQFDERVSMGTFAGWLTDLNCTARQWRADQDSLPPVEETSPIILLGGYMGVGERDRLPYLQRAADWLAAAVEKDRRLLAICLGGQLLAHALGARVDSQHQQERGLRDIAMTAAGQSDPLFSGLPNPFVSFEWHNDSFVLPEKAVHLAATETCYGQTFRYRNAWGLQFHPEVDESIVAEWSRLTGADEGPLLEFRRRQDEYYRHSRQLLKNFINY